MVMPAKTPDANRAKPGSYWRRETFGNARMKIEMNDVHTTPRKKPRRILRTSKKKSFVRPGCGILNQDNEMCSFLGGACGNL